MALVIKNPLVKAGDVRYTGSIPELGRSSPEGNSNPLQYFLPGEPLEQRSLPGYSPWGCKESDTSEGTQHTSMGKNRLEKVE